MDSAVTACIGRKSNCSSGGYMDMVVVVVTGVGAGDDSIGIVVSGVD